jgi:uncharacterized protein (TIGR03435 family)
LVKNMNTRFTPEIHLMGKLKSGAALLMVMAALWFILLDAAPGRCQAVTGNTPASLADTWQGTLHEGQDVRVVFKISKAEDVYKAVFYSIDQGLELPVTQITYDGSTVKMTVEMGRATFDGKLSADSKSITGKWTQGPIPLPLILSRASAETAWAIPTLPTLHRMDANASPAFEVATIKPAKPDATNKFFLLGGGRLEAVNANLDDLITFAYGLHPKQVVGAPAWAETDKFDIEGKPDREGLPSLDQWKVMVQKLLAERCQLTFHHEQKEIPVYILSVDKGGPKLNPSLGNAMGLPGLGFRHGPGGDFVARNASMGDFINSMTRNVKLDRPILDRTGLTGRYDFALDWTPDDSQFNGTGSRLAETDSTLPSLYVAMQQQLGLKLEAVKAPADVLVIDHVEKPSEN